MGNMLLLVTQLTVPITLGNLGERHTQAGRVVSRIAPFGVAEQQML